MKNIRAFAVATSLALGLAAASVTAATESTEPAAESYPLTTCVVSGEPLGSMGKPIVYEIRFCCKDCLKGFLKEPKKYIDKLEAAKKLQAAGATSHEDQAEAGTGHAEEHAH
jgi:hypothetical protein